MKKIPLVLKSLVLAAFLSGLAHAGGPAGERVNINTADAGTIDRVLVGVGPSKAEAIVRFRESRPAPAFTKPTDLTQVRGIGDITAQKLAPYLYLPDPPHSAAGTAGSE